MPGRTIIRFFLGAALFAGAGCGPVTLPKVPESLASMPRMTLGTSGRHVPYLWTAEATPSPASEYRVVGYNRATVQTTVRGQPVTGAQCRVIAPDANVSFQTPAKVALPVMHRPLPPATLFCRFSGMEGRRTLHADRSMEHPDREETTVMGISLTKVTSFVSGSLDMWSYVRNGSVLTIELAPQRSGGME
jgi:hypothetical protein